LKSFKTISVISFVILISFSGCSVWNNFTAYFNRYYNAKLKFDEAEESMKLESKKGLFDFKEDQISAKNKAALESVIDKCSKIMQFNKESAFFDDAIFMIGKSYYYQGVYLKALRKFKELQTITDSDLLLENELWIAKSLYQNRQFDEANIVIERTIETAIKEDEPEIITEAYLTKVRYLILNEQTDEAIKNVNLILNYCESDVLNAQILYELGKLYLSVNDFENAASAFERVNDFSPNYDIEFLSKLEYAKVKRKLGDYENSLIFLDDLYNEDKYKDKRDQIDLEIGEVYYAQNQIEKSLEKFTSMDSLYKSSASTGNALFRRAEILEKDLIMLDSARVLYDKVSQSNAIMDLKNFAKSKVTVLNKLKTLKEAVKNSERDLSYIIDTNNFKADSIKYKNYQTKRDSLKQFFKEMKQLEGTTFDSTKYAKIKPPFSTAPVFPKIPIDSVKSNIVRNKYELANLFFGELNIPDSSRSQYEDILVDYPGSKLEAKALFALGSYFLTKDRKDIADSLFREIYVNHKFSPVADAAAERLGLEKSSKKNDPAENFFITAENFIDQKKYKQAISALKKIYRENPSSPYSAKALYTIGFLYENELQKKDSAAAAYDTLSRKYSKTEFANAVRSKLSFYNSRQKALSDSLAKVNAPKTEKKVSPDENKNKIDDKIDSPQNLSKTEAVKSDSLKNESQKTMSKDFPRTDNSLKDSLSNTEKKTRVTNPKK
jgi:tetratricopeptide (TPR) repeat protein